MRDLVQNNQLAWDNVDGSQNLVPLISTVTKRKVRSAENAGVIKNKNTKGHKKAELRFVFILKACCLSAPKKRRNVS
ncbi:hypothetical protein EBZ37_05470 [bacterium]|nr:hypothetical protein [bacterium]